LSFLIFHLRLNVNAPYSSRPLLTSSSSAPPGVPPHELLQKLQLVQQEQSQAPHEAPRHGPALAPRFQGATATQDPGSALGPGNEAGKHFPVCRFYKTESYHLSFIDIILCILFCDMLSYEGTCAGRIVNSSH